MIDTENRSIEFLEAQVPMLYANSVNFQMSVWDFTFDFGMLQQATKEKLVILPEARIIMSPQHAKVFSDILARRIEQYEEKYGRIPSVERGDGGE